VKKRAGHRGEGRFSVRGTNKQAIGKNERNICKHNYGFLSRIPPFPRRKQRNNLPVRGIMRSRQQQTGYLPNCGNGSRACCSPRAEPRRKGKIPKARYGPGASDATFPRAVFLAGHDALHSRAWRLRATGFHRAFNPMDSIHCFTGRRWSLADGPFFVRGWNYTVRTRHPEHVHPYWLWVWVRGVRL